jgi:hypothetical protein
MMVSVGSAVARKGTVGVVLAGLLAAASMACAQAPGRSMREEVGSMQSATNEERREALEEILGDLGLAFEVERFVIAPREGYPRTEGANIVVTAGQGEGDIIVGGHYDAAWLDGGMLSGGAVDNASSVVVLAHLAALLSGSPPDHRVRVVFFDMEEIGLVGSRRFVERHRGEPIRAGVNLDVNGYGDTVVYGPASAEGNELLYSVMREHCALGLIACLEASAYPSSDHLSFQAAGIPNISFSLLPGEEAADLGRFMGPERVSLPEGFVPPVLQVIHSPLDTVDRIEDAALAESLRSLEAFIRRLDAALE